MTPEDDVQALRDLLKMWGKSHMLTNPDTLRRILDRLEAAEKDAARYRWLQYRTAGLRDNEGRAYFSFPSMFGLRPVSDIMRGSVAQHLDAAIDAAMKDTP